MPRSATKKWSPVKCRPRKSTSQPAASVFSTFKVRRRDRPVSPLKAQESITDGQSIQPYLEYVHPDPPGQLVIHNRMTVTTVTTDTVIVAPAASACPVCCPSSPTEQHCYSYPPDCYQEGYPNHGVVHNEFCGYENREPNFQFNRQEFPSLPPKLEQNLWVTERINSILTNVEESKELGITPVIEYDQFGENWSDFELVDAGFLRLKLSGIKRKFIRAKGQQENRFTIITTLLSRIRSLLEQDSYATKRDLYYENVGLFGDQRQVDYAVDTITLILKVPRDHLNVVASSRGLVAGHLKFRNELGVVVDCMLTTEGIPVPYMLDFIQILECDAQVIFVIEKDATFQQLREDEICWKENQRCIMLTGKGYADVSTRRFLQLLSGTLCIPVYIITDCDPHGVDIMCMYRYGTKAPHFENMSLALPHARWLGVFPSDLNRFGVDQGLLQPLTENDKKLALDLIRRPYCSLPMRQELELMLERNIKAEIQNIATIAPRFAVDVYLPVKLEQNHWI